MNNPAFMDLLQANVNVGLQVALPFLGALLLVGVLVGLIQAATQVNEPSIPFLAKLLTLVALLATLGPWALDKAKSNLQENIKAISAYPQQPKPAPVKPSLPPGNR